MKRPYLVLGNVIIAASYYILTTQILIFAWNFQRLSLYKSMEKIRNEKKKQLFRFLIALGGLFAAFIMLCGNTHTLQVLKFSYPDNHGIDVAIEVMMWLCAGVSFVTAIIGLRLFPLILEMLSKFELNSEGKLENAQNYLLEVVEMVQESIMVINDDCVVERCNEASRTLFSKDVVGKCVRSYIHHEDAERFNQAILRVLGSYNFAPVNVEYRIKVNLDPSGSIGEGEDLPDRVSKRRLPSAQDVRVHCELAPIVASRISQALPDFSADTVNMALNALATSNRQQQGQWQGQGESEQEYVWIESTICKGMRLTVRDDLEYDLKMASRNIDSRKRKTLGLTY